jgi:flagellar biosynthesis protein FlhB
MEIPFGFSMTTVLNWLVILAVLVSGYFLYLIFIKRKENKNSKAKNEIEIFLDVLAFGVIVVGLTASITGILSIINGHEFVNDNIYIGFGLYLIIFISAFGIALFNCRKAFSSLKKTLLYFIFLLMICLLFFNFLPLIKEIYDKNLGNCYSQWLKQPNLTEYNESTIDNEICKTICYDKYKIFNSSNESNNICYCDIHNCHNLTLTIK